ncbi:inositol monophosphatase family protein [Hirschia litorea]|uniref:Inositol-1-monophosphatase n=1 Tax=Hirschia litorea TaxID=1199156 RepID=A0ABW2INT6_9PROT
MSRPSPTVSIMIEAAQAAGRKLLRDFGEVENLQVSKKGPADFVSAADKKAEQICFDRLSKKRPGYGFLMEEAGVIEGSDKSHRFIVDPLDGTTNFLHGIPHFAVSIGLERDGELRAGVVHDVIRNEIFWAETGEGAWLENRRLRISNRRKLGESVIATGIPFMGRGDHTQYIKELHVLMGEVAGIRRFGAAALDLAYVASGRFDGFWERGLAPWDVAAGIVLVREAGGEVSGLNGAHPLNDGDLVCGNTTITAKLIDRVEGKIKPKV